MSKTPDYIKRAQDNYRAKLTRKVIDLHNVNDAELIKAIETDPQPFKHTVVKLLKKYYNID